MIKLFAAKYLPLSIFLCYGSLIHAQGSDTDNEPAPDRWFEVELIVFQHTASPTNERWTEELEADQRMTENDQDIARSFAIPGDQQQSANDFSSTSESNQPKNEQSLTNEKPLIELKMADGTPLFDVAEALNENQQNAVNDAWIILPTEQHKLTAEAGHLKVSKEYNVLFHQAWRQPMVTAEQSSWVVVRGGERFTDQYSLQGSIRFSLRRYLHARTDLYLQELAPIKNIQNNSIEIDETSTDRSTTNELSPEIMYQALRTFRLQQSRRMRSVELHYIDSPVIGVLIKITPYNNEDELIEAIEEPEVTTKITPPATEGSAPEIN